MERLPSVAITIPTWKRRELFKRSVESLLNQDYPGHIEVMCVVDHEDPSFDSTAFGNLDLCEGDRYSEPNDLGIAYMMHKAAMAGGFPGLRSVRVKMGPGRSNWRPGAIHFPVFEHWLQTKCDYVGYQFSDEYSHPSRIGMQVAGMLQGKALWSYCGNTHIVDYHDQTLEVRTYNWARTAAGANTLMTPTILANRNAFEAVGGLDYPLHAAAKAEIWIQTHCALMGNPSVWRPKEAAYYFIQHNESLGNGQKPGSAAYQQAINETGFLEEDHWRLWNRIDQIHNERVNRARHG